jgi:hypothetical protein
VIPDGSVIVLEEADVLIAAKPFGKFPLKLSRASDITRRNET